MTFEVSFKLFTYFIIRKKTDVITKKNLMKYLLRLSVAEMVQLFMWRWMDDLQFYDFFLAVFQSYEDDRWVIMKGCVQWNPFKIEKILASGGNWTGNPRSVGKCLTHWATVLLFIYLRIKVEKMYVKSTFNSNVTVVTIDHGWCLKFKKFQVLLAVMVILNLDFNLKIIAWL